MDFKKLKTTIAFTKNLFTTGAFTETSRKVELEICKKLPKGDQKVVVEYGMGHGNITREILKNISPTSKVYAFEVKEEFCRHVRENIKDERLIIVNDGAEHLHQHVKEPVDAFIASIPFTFFSKEVAQKIIQEAYDALAPGGYYSQVLYTKFNYKKFVRVFDKCERIKIPNIPTEYIYHCRKEG